MLRTQMHCLSRVHWMVLKVISRVNPMMGCEFLDLRRRERILFGWVDRF